MTYDFDCPLQVAAVFLASPVAALPGMECGSDGKDMWLRGGSCPAGASVNDYAASALSLAQRTSEPGDRYIDLSADPEHWFKFVTSGAQGVVFGPDILWGAPRIHAHEGVPAAEVSEMVALLRRDPGVELPLMLAGGNVVASGDDVRVELTYLGGVADVPVEPVVPAPVRARVAAEHLAERTGSELLSVTPGDEAGAWVATVALDGRQLLTRFTMRGGVFSFEHRVPGDGSVGLTIDGDVLVHPSGIVFRSV